MSIMQWVNLVTLCPGSTSDVHMMAFKATAVPSADVANTLFSPVNDNMNWPKAKTFIKDITILKCVDLYQ